MRPNPSQTPESAGERGSSAPAAARHRPKVDEVRIGLALSGGGFRATLFHLGVVRYLLDAGLLKRVRCICSVSGGSILGAHLVHNWSAYNWLEGVTTEEDLRPVTKQIVPQRPGHKADRVFRAGEPADFEEAAAQIIAFTKKDVRGRILRRLPATALGSLLPFNDRHRTDLLRDAYRELFGRSYLDEGREKNPAAPKLHVLATNLTTGQMCSFSADGFWTGNARPAGADADDGATPGTLHPTGLIETSFAVAASSAFPAFFPPLDVLPEDLGIDKQDAKLERQYVTDGGAYDNLGARRFQNIIASGEDRLDFVIVSDAGASFQWQLGRRFSGTLGTAIRSSDILMRRITELEYESMERREKLAEFVNLRIQHLVSPTEVANREPDAETLPEDVQRRVRDIRTDLDAFSDLEIRALVQHGYEVAREVIGPKFRAHGIAPAPTPVLWNPIPEGHARRVDYTKDDAQQLKRSAKRSLHAFSFKDWHSWVHVAVLGLMIWFSPEVVGFGKDLFYRARGWVFPNETFAMDEQPFDHRLDFQIAYDSFDTVLKAYEQKTRLEDPERVAGIQRCIDAYGAGLVGKDLLEKLADIQPLIPMELRDDFQHLHRIKSVAGAVGRGMMEFNSFKKPDAQEPVEEWRGRVYYEYPNVRDRVWMLFSGRRQKAGDTTEFDFVQWGERGTYYFKVDFKEHEDRTGEFSGLLMHPKLGVPFGKVSLGLDAAASRGRI